MTAQSNAQSYEAVQNRSNVFGEGLISGLIGAAAVAAWFLVLDIYFGRPLFTPNILGTVLFQGGLDLASVDTIPISFETVFIFTWIHVLVFCVIGVMGAWLIQLAEKDPNYGFGIILFCVVLEFGFIGASMIVALSILHALTLPAILIGNLIAIAAMGLYFRRLHPNLTFYP